MNTIRALAVAAALVATGGILQAHGGMYRGPWNGTPTVPPGGGPLTGGPVPPGGGPGGPITGGRPSIGDGTSWQVWWEFNKEPLLALPAVPAYAPVSGSDEFFLGGQRAFAGRDTMAPSEQDRRDLIAAALLRALRGNQNRDVVTACLVGLAKVGLDPAGAELPKVFAGFVDDGDQEVREAAALAFGIAGHEAAMGTLASLVDDTSAGRKLVGRNRVPGRVQTFAAWSMGLLARRADGPVLKRRAYELLSGHLKRDERDRDLRVALIHGMGLVRPDPLKGGAEKRLLWEIVGKLWSYYDLDLGKGDQLIQAHVPIAVARLLGRGDSAEHQRSKQILAGELRSKKRRHNAIYQSAALALGSLCLAQEAGDDEAAVSRALLDYYREGTDQLARFLSVLALGRIGGDANRAALLSVYGSANKAIEKPWIALALGLIARERAAGGEVDIEVGRMLLADLKDIDYDDAEAAIALAIGLCGYQDAANTLIDMLNGRMNSDMLVGYVAVSLALLDHEPAADHLVELMKRSIRRPFVLQQCAVALGRLGDVRAVPLLQEMLAESNSTATLAAVANALGSIGDRRSIEPLIKALADPGRTKLGRAFVAAALGGIGDKDELPWNTPIAIGMNYMATVDTLTNGSTGVLDIL